MHSACLQNDASEPCADKQCRGDGGLVRVAFVHHALHMGGVERQIELTWQVFKCWCPRADQPVLCLHTHTHKHTRT